MATMRTSTPGISKLRRWPTRGRLPAYGFTLLELLVVMVIIGIALAVVSVRLLPNDSDRVRRVGEQLSLLLENAGLEARSSGVSMAWAGKHDSYLFYQRNDEGLWESVQTGPYRQRMLEQGVTILSVELDGKPVKPGTRLPLPASSFALPFNIKLGAGASVLYVVGNGVGRVNVTLDKDANALAPQ